MATSSNAVIHALKIALISSAVVVIAVLLTPQLPGIWSSLLSWLRPPYLYVIINGIIITIAASSRLHHHYTHPHPPHTDDNDTFRHIHSPPVDPYTSKSAQVPGSGFDFSNFGAPEVAMYSETTTFRAEVTARNYEPETANLIDSNEYVEEKPKNNHFTASVEEIRSTEQTESVNRINYKVAVAENVPETVSLAEPKDVVPSVEEIRSTEAAAEESVNRRSVRPPQPLARQETFDVVSSFFQTQYQEKPLPAARRPAPTPLAETAKERNHKIASAPPPLARQETSEMVSSFFQTQIEKPPPSARFGHHRRPVKISQEGGKALRVAKPKRTETLESTWKTITEGRQLPLTRHLKKSDTWENHHREGDSSMAEASPVKKSETFSERTNYTAAAAAAVKEKLRKDPSLSQEELNRRVEAFINKVNTDMKLQRQQSMQQFMDMINRATY